MPTAETLEIKLDNDLAKTLQSNAEAQELSISEFVRRAVRFYLRLCEEMEIRRQYQKGYDEADLAELALEMKDWEEEQVWPESWDAAISTSAISKNLIKHGDGVHSKINLTRFAASRTASSGDLAA
jgi:hypothetical protein